MAFYFRLTQDPICIEDGTRQLNLDGNGAVVTFSGHIRPQDAGGQLLSHMDYEAYEEMAEPEARKIADTIREKWGIEQLAVIHRYGRVDVGEPSVVIAVASGHRPEAFDACRYAIDELKRTVPLWKNEVIAARAEA
jgi:molybdopterin synthase catalytic subunit